jgi:hypothetical protein
LAIKEGRYFQEIIDEVPNTYAGQLAEAYILGMREVERSLGATPWSQKLIAFGIDETEARLETRRLYLKEGIDF